MSFSRIGYSICLAMTLICLVYGILFGVACLISSPVEWYKLNVQSIEALNALKVFYPSLSLLLFLSVVWTVFSVVLHHFAEEQNKIITHLIVIFSVIYCIMVSINYYVQIVIVGPSIMDGSSSNLSIISQTNVYSVMSAVDMLGYFFLGVAQLLLSALFKQERLVRGSLIISGISCMSGVFGQILHNMTVISISGITMTVFPLIAFFILCLWFRKNASQLKGR